MNENLSGTQFTHESQARLCQTMEPFIMKKALQYAGCFNVLTDDLQQAGRLEALKLARNYDDTRGGFYGYSFRSIMRAMRVTAQRAQCAISVPDRHYWFSGISTTSLDAPFGRDPDGDTLADVIGCEETTTAAVDANEKAALIEEALAKLPLREQFILRGRFFKDQSLEDLSKVLKLCRERVRQIEQEALSKLRKFPQLQQIAA